MFETYAVAMEAAQRIANGTGWTARVYSEDSGFDVLTVSDADAHLIEDTQIAVVLPQ